jgi:integrase
MSSKSNKSGKPSKPYPEFPLGAANNGRWQKRIKGRLYYFGRWGKVVDGVMTRLSEDGNWREALDIYRVRIDDIQAGREIVEPSKKDDPDALTVGRMCNRFLSAKLQRLKSGEISARSFAEYRASTERMIETFGAKTVIDNLRATDFAKLRELLAEKFGPHRLCTEIVMIKSVFKFALKSDVVDHDFKKPSKAVLRKHRLSRPKRLFSAEEARALIEKAGTPLRAMILLALNAGFGNSDVATLPLSALDLDKGWVEFPRPKTGIERRAKLWAETIAALRTAIAARPTPQSADDQELVFITRWGARWVRSELKERKNKESEEQEEKEKGPGFVLIDSVSFEFGKLLRTLKIKKEGVGYYALRHTFRTIADGSKDTPAIRYCMGHADGSIDDVYRETIDDSRLIAVSDHVRAWLFPKAETAPTEDKPRPKQQADDSSDRPTLKLFAEGEVA